MNEMTCRRHWKLARAKYENFTTHNTGHLIIHVIMNLLLDKGKTGNNKNSPDDPSSYLQTASSAMVWWWWKLLLSFRYIDSSCILLLKCRRCDIYPSIFIFIFKPVLCVERSRHTSSLLERWSYTACPSLLLVVRRQQLGGWYHPLKWAVPPRQYPPTRVWNFRVLRKEREPIRKNPRYFPPPGRFCCCCCVPLFLTAAPLAARTRKTTLIRRTTQEMTIFSLSL